MASFSSSTHLQPWNRIQSLREDSRHRTSSVDGADVEREEPTDPLTAECRERFNLFEKLIPHLFPTNRPCCPASDGPLPIEFSEPAKTESAQPDKVPAPATRRDEDDDYDFDDDEDDEPAPKPSTPASRPTLMTVTSGGVQGDTPKGSTPQNAEKAGTPATATRERIEADRAAAEITAKNALSTLFYTLENDRDAMLEQQKLDESDRQVNAETSAPGGPQQGKLSTANLGASSLTLKHLIARIDAKRERVEVSDMELRNLMSEVKKNRSKWASEEKVGQEELYEAAEKVVLELRAQTEHSTAFLNRVNKREAPDYFNSM